MTDIKVRRKMGDKIRRITSVHTVLCSRDFPQDENEFTVTEKELPDVLRYGNMVRVLHSPPSVPPAIDSNLREVKKIEEKPVVTGDTTSVSSDDKSVSEG